MRFRVRWFIATTFGAGRKEVGGAADPTCQKPGGAIAAALGGASALALLTDVSGTAGRSFKLAKITHQEGRSR